MKKVRVVVKDRNTLVLEEAASQGDYIDLSSLSNVDFSNIEALIESGKDTIYQKKLKEYQEHLALEKESSLTILRQELENKHQEEVAKLKTTISEYDLKKASELKELEASNEKKYQELSSAKQLEIEKIKAELNTLQNSMNEKMENDKLKLDNAYREQLANLKNEIEQVKQKNELALKDKELEIEKRIQKMKDDYQHQLQEKDMALREKEEAYLTLQRQRAALNVKQTGEDLEAWCNHEMLSYMQNGLENCTWEKDNLVVREENEAKGSKADYIFKVYANSTHLPEELLTSVCLDMKDENPDSVNKKKNSDYYKDLDKNRLKKNCKYAILVSNLEMDKPNDLPIFRVNEYKDMYVVRPAYMMTFLNMIVSLSKRFAELILADKDAKLELKNTLELKEQFDSLKNTYLDKPLEQLGKNIDLSLIHI